MKVDGLLIRNDITKYERRKLLFWTPYDKITDAIIKLSLKLIKFVEKILWIVIFLFLFSQLLVQEMMIREFIKALLFALLIRIFLFIFPKIWRQIEKLKNFSDEKTEKVFKKNVTIIFYEGYIELEYLNDITILPFSKILDVSEDGNEIRLSLHNSVILLKKPDNWNELNFTLNDLYQK